MQGVAEEIKFILSIDHGWKIQEIFFDGEENARCSSSAPLLFNDVFILQA